MYVLEDLTEELKIYQNKNGFRFGLDALLLAYFAQDYIHPNDKICEIGTGTGVIPLLLASRTRLKQIDCFEIQEKPAFWAQKSVELNKLEDKINIINQDINKQNLYKNICLDLVITNPPYFPSNSGLFISKDKNKRLSRSEITLNLEDIFKFCLHYLKEGGKLLMINRPTRLAEIFKLASQNQMAVKKLRFVYPRINEKARMVLLQISKTPKTDLIVEEPLIIYKKDEEYTKELKKIYHLI